MQMDRTGSQCHVVPVKVEKDTSWQDKIYDACGTMDILRAALALVSGLKREISDDNCTESETVQAILGHSGSRPTIAFAPVVGSFHIPVVSQCKKSVKCCWMSQFLLYFAKI